MIEQYFEELTKHPDYQVLKRISMHIKENRPSQESRVFMTTIIDLETMGMDATQHEIIEIGMLSFSFTNEEGILKVNHKYNELNDPGKPIPAEITKITGIRNEVVLGRSIDWGLCVGST